MNGQVPFTRNETRTEEMPLVKRHRRGFQNVGHGDIFGLPYALQAKADLFQVYRNDVEDTSATIVAAVATTATTSTGDVRGTVATGVAADTTSVVVWGAFVSPNSTDGLRGVAQA